MTLFPGKKSEIREFRIGNKEVLISSDGLVRYKFKWKRAYPKDVYKCFVNDKMNLKRKKTVYKYEIGGKYTGEKFDSMSEASLSVGMTYCSPMSLCCNLKKKNWKGFEWSFLKPEEYNVNLQPNNKSSRYPLRSRFSQCNLDYSEVEMYNLSSICDEELIVMFVDIGEEFKFNFD